MRRTLKWGVFKYSFALFGRPKFANDSDPDQITLGPFERCVPRPLQVPIGREPFSSAEVLHGATASKDFQAQVPDSVWVEYAGSGECMRYYAHGFGEGEHDTVLVYLSGDTLLIDNKGTRKIVTSYETASPAQLQNTMQVWSAQGNVPAIFLARPGMYGSSGSHHLRRHEQEITLVDLALTAIKERYSIKCFVLAGQSGGGMVAASLLSKRSDLRAVVLSSALLSVARTAAYWEFQRDIPMRYLYDAKGFYDPLENVAQFQESLGTPIYILSDPRDRAVPFSIQMGFVNALRDAGHEVHHIFAHAPQPTHHVLTEHARIVAAAITRGCDPHAVRAHLGIFDMRNVGYDQKPRPFIRMEQPMTEAQSVVCQVVHSDGTVETVYEKMPEMSISPASLTKLLTALVVSELMPQFSVTLSDRVRIEEEDPAAGSGFNVKPGEAITLKDAFPNLMLPSSNITANALARMFGQKLLDHEGRSDISAVDRFMLAVNDKAQALGMAASTFKNPSGQGAKGQVSCVADIAKLMQAALVVPEISENWGHPAHEMTVFGEGGITRQQKIVSTVKVIQDYDVVGGKTGTLIPGVYNLALVSKAPNGDTLISVHMKAPDPHALYQGARHVLDAVKRGRDW